ncbi:MAG: hypothetical protein AB7I30_14740 [Isosphaeraceae bacterium]
MRRFSFSPSTMRLGTYVESRVSYSTQLYFARDALQPAAAA